MRRLKKTLTDIFIKFLQHENTQPALNKIIKLRKQSIPLLDNSAHPYNTPPPNKKNNIDDSDTIIITSRFRSGSSVFWNIFRQQICTAYYEPFNERKWFLSHHRGDHVDASHIGITDYWNEYKGLDYLDKFYQEDWVSSGLHMDESTFFPNMNHFINALIKHANGKCILQFNRIDFRLGWIKANYPKAKLIHLYRHPRDQWCSFLIDKKVMNKDDVQQTYTDAFYLDVWCKDLEKHFPFLSSSFTPHPYQRFYYLWKLSFLYGQKYADLSISFENLVNNSQDTLLNLSRQLNWGEFDIEKSLSILEEVDIDKWKEYADENWFYEKEQECEDILDLFINTLGKT